MLLALALASCGGGDNKDDTAGALITLSPIPSPAAPLPDTPGLILHSDATSTAVYAVDPTDGSRWHIPLDQMTVQLLKGGDCTRNGRSFAYVMEDFAANVSHVIITGDGSRTINIDGSVQGLAWSPDGRTIALSEFDQETRAYHLRLLDTVSESSTPVPAAGSAGTPRWSPDGSYLAYTARNAQTNSNELYVWKVGSDTSQKVLDGEAGLYADWSPDGRKLIFSGPLGDGLQLFTVSLQSGEIAQLTATQTIKTIARWSADGRLIAYVGEVPLPTVSRYAARSHNVGVWTVNADGSGEMLHTDLNLDAWLVGWCLSGPWLDQGWVKD